MMHVTISAIPRNLSIKHFFMPLHITWPSVPKWNHSCNNHLAVVMITTITSHWTTIKTTNRTRFTCAGWRAIVPNMPNPPNYAALLHRKRSKSSKGGVLTYPYPYLSQMMGSAQRLSSLPTNNWIKVSSLATMEYKIDTLWFGYFYTNCWCQWKSLIFATSLSIKFSRIINASVDNFMGGQLVRPEQQSIESLPSFHCFDTQVTNWTWTFCITLIGSQ